MLKKLLAVATAAPLVALGVQVTASAAVRPKPLLVCTATVSSQHPVDYSTVVTTVRVGAAGIKTAVTANYKTVRTTMTGVSVLQPVGDMRFAYLAHAPFKISDAKPGYKVQVNAVVSRPGWRSGSCSTWFIPQAKPKR
ncbi:MAG TPA: hypothetical protein VGG75_14070 [Trebonia sp.]|jgi:hypothetical protein